jgi:hypothetical protein
MTPNTSHQKMEPFLEELFFLFLYGGFTFWRYCMQRLIHQ